jgi:hypothetical protein
LSRQQWKSLHVDGDLRTICRASKLGSLAIDNFPTRGPSKAEFAQANGQTAVPRLKALLNADAADIAKFERMAIPELMREALENPDPGEQRAALQALAASRNSAAASTLATISRTTRSPRLSSLASQLSQAIAPK